MELSRPEPIVISILLVRRGLLAEQTFCQFFCSPILDWTFRKKSDPSRRSGKILSRPLPHYDHRRLKLRAPVGGHLLPHQTGGNFGRALRQDGSKAFHDLVATFLLVRRLLASPSQRRRQIRRRPLPCQFLQRRALGRIVDEFAKSQAPGRSHRFCRILPGYLQAHFLQSIIAILLCWLLRHLLQRRIRVLRRQFFQFPHFFRPTHLNVRCFFDRCLRRRVAFGQIIGIGRRWHDHGIHRLEVAGHRRRGRR